MQFYLIQNRIDKLMQFRIDFPPSCSNQFCRNVIRAGDLHLFNFSTQRHWA